MRAFFIGGLGPTELIIILVIVLLLFGGSRLAGLGKSTGRALKEFKEETKGLRDSDKAKDAGGPPATPPSVDRGPAEPEWPQRPADRVEDPDAPRSDVRRDA